MRFSTKGRHTAYLGLLAAGLAWVSRCPAAELETRHLWLRAEGHLHVALESTDQGGARLSGADLAGSEHVVGGLRKGLGHGIIGEKRLDSKGSISEILSGLGCRVGPDCVAGAGPP